jgi:dihydrofolate synthase/folylpolyglutamate synthase
MNFNEALQYMRGRLRFGVKLGNDRFLALLDRLGNPHLSLRVIHVAGTKGKGSTVTMVESILRAAGYRTGTYLSPYVYNVRERIQVNGSEIPEEDFARLISRIKPHVECLETTEFGPVTEFEIKTAVGICYLSEMRVDYAVIEVGLGGRLDATNVFPAPLVTVITNIGYDHVELLGPTLTHIAREKAGIIKPGVPCVTGVAPSHEAYAPIKDICIRNGSLLTTTIPEETAAADINLDNAFQWSGETDGTLNIRTGKRELKGLRLRLHGAFQWANAALAISALDAMVDECCPIISNDHVRIGLETAYLPGRLEVISHRPKVIVDVAHNELSAQALASALRVELSALSDNSRLPRLILVAGLSRNHEPADFLDPLLSLSPWAVIATQPKFHPRDACEVAAVAAGAKTRLVRVVPEGAVEACRLALSLATDNDLICLSGSFYTVGDVQRNVWQDLLDNRGR